MKKYIFLLLILFFAGSTFAYTIEGNSVMMQDAQASLRVTPATARFPSPEGYRQEFEVCNKTGTTTDLFGAYVFNHELQDANAEYLTSQGYEWVEYEKLCAFEFDFETNVNPAPNVHQIECFYINSDQEKIITFDMGFKSGDPITGIMKYDINELVKNWSNVTDSFEKKEIGERFAYIYTSGKEVLANSCETWRITYTPNIADATEKWDLWLWAGEEWDCILTDTCLKTLKLDPWWSGAGSSGDPWIITDCNMLANLESYTRSVAAKGDAGNQYWELGNDIDCSAHGNFEPIGNAVTDIIFWGHLDGANYSISSLTVNYSAVGAALFATIGADATVKDLALINFNITNSANGTGVFAMYCSGSVIEDVFVQGAIVNSTGEYYAAGFVGYALGSCIIKDSYVVDSTVTVDGGVQRTGGFAGALASDANISTCYSNAAVSGGGAGVGAFVGWLSGAICPNSFFDSDTAVEADNACGTGLTTVNMFKEASFTNWDFTSIWRIDEDVNYPTLLSFYTPPSNPPTWDSIDLNVIYAKENGHIKVTAATVADAESDAVTLLCGTASNPTTDSNNFCTSYAIPSPYTTVECTGNGAAGDGAQTVYCRLYDGSAYSIQKTDTYTADNTDPTVAALTLDGFLLSETGNYIDDSGYFFALVTDSNISNCEYTLDGVAWAAATYDGSYCSAPTIVIADKVFYSFNIRATDQAYNIGYGTDLNYTGNTLLVNPENINDDEFINIGFTFATSVIIGAGVLAFFLIMLACLVFMKKTASH